MLKREDQLKAAGMESCALKYKEQIAMAKRIAFECALEKGQITASDVRDEAGRRGLSLPFKDMGGTLFRGKEWEKVAPSTARNPGSHGHTLWIWKLKNPPKAAMAVPVRKTEPEKKQVYASDLFDLQKHVAYENLP